MVADNLRQGVGVTQVVYDLIKEHPDDYMLLYVGSRPIDARFERLEGLTIVKEVSWFAILKAITAFKTKGCRIIHAHGKTDIVCIMGRFAGFSVLRTVHYGAYSETTRNDAGLRQKAARLRNLLTGYMWWVNHWIGVSESSRKNIISRWEIPEHKTSVIYNGIDVDVFHVSSAKEKHLLRANFGWRKKWIICLSVGTLAKRKRHDSTIKGFAKISEKFPEARLMIAGDGAEQAYLEALIKRLDLREKVFLLGRRSDIANIMRASDFLVHNAVDEAFGLVVAEAMCTGLTPVVLSGGGPAEIVTDKKTGLLMQLDDPTSFQSAISYLISDPQSRQELAQAAHDHAINTFSAHTTQIKYAELYSLFRQNASHKIPQLVSKNGKINR